MGINFKEIARQEREIEKLEKRKLFSVKGLVKKAGSLAKKGACAAFGKKGLDMCKQAVSAGVKKAGSFLKSKLKTLDLSKGEGCVKALGNALCDKAYKKACGKTISI